MMRLSLARARAALYLLLAAGLMALLWHHASDFGLYRGYLLEPRPGATLRFNGLSALLDEAAMQKQLAGVPLRCADAQAGQEASEPRVCRADIGSLNGVPAMRLAAYFGQGRLLRVAVDAPWWAHHAMLRQLMADFGAPAAMDAASVFRPAVQWRTRGGLLGLERAPGFDPLRTVALQWRADAVPIPAAPNLP